MAVPALFMSEVCMIPGPLSADKIEKKLMEIVRVKESTTNRKVFINYANWIITWCKASKQSLFEPIIVLDIVDRALSRMIVEENLDLHSKTIITDLEMPNATQNPMMPTTTCKTKQNLRLV
jgi:hypothetical protein